MPSPHGAVPQALRRRAAGSLGLELQGWKVDSKKFDPAPQVTHLIEAVHMALAQACVVSQHEKRHLKGGAKSGSSSNGEVF
ncbi:hypothetical protein [Janthinobacterium sp. UMAB-56]|uniref:hypothetical protein n=1 Tax=Janthinobacterium sp. UMAB-56 TaxID=1365361 RepID=UPI001C56D0FE|nr:hypothetical protein [Janthinobacterium sp. UMAB-56]